MLLSTLVFVAALLLSAVTMELLGINLNVMIILILAISGPLSVLVFRN